MIPPANMIQDESGGKEDERDQNETPKSPTATASQQETKVGLSGYYFLFTNTAGGYDHSTLDNRANFYQLLNITGINN